MDAFDDRRLLQFETYEDYLDSYVTKEDLQNLRSTEIARKIAELGYRSPSETLTREQFEYRKSAVHEIYFPSRKPHMLYSDSCEIYDRVLRELANRERANRVGLLSTIIFIRQRTKSGYEISGYIDYQHSLKRSRGRVEGAVDWPAVFSSKTRLWPSSNDLGFYNWRSGYSKCNDTENYKVITDPMRGLIFINLQDRKTILTDPLLDSPGSNTVRINLSSDKYEHVVLFDHVGRKKL